MERKFNPKLANCEKGHFLSSVEFTAKYRTNFPGTEKESTVFDEWRLWDRNVVFHCPDATRFVNTTVKDPSTAFCQNIKCPFWNTEGADIKAMYQENPKRRY